MTAYAHTAALPDGKPDPAEGRWQPLAGHLRRLAPREHPLRLDPILRSRWGEGGQRPDEVFAWSSEGGRRLGEGRRWPKQRTNSPSAVRDYPDSESGFRDGTAPCATENHVLPAFLEMVFDQPQNATNGSLN